MNSIYSQLKFEHLQRFVTLAEEMHFGRAAQRLRIDQPTLSRSIRQLEQAVGQRLFDRSTRAIALNAAGRVFLEEARRTLQQSQLAAEMAQRAALEDERTLRVALTPGALFGKVFMAAITSFREQWPRAKLEFDIVPSAVQLDQLRSGAIDLAFHSQGTGDVSGIEVRTIESIPFAAFMPSHWPLAQRESVRLAEFAGLPFIRPVSELRAAVETACRAAGFMPNFVLDSGHGYVNMAYVVSGMAMGLQAETWAPVNVDGVAVVPVSDLPDYLRWTCELAWIPRALSPSLAALIENIQAVSAAVSRRSAKTTTKEAATAAPQAEAGKARNKHAPGKPSRRRGARTS